MSNLVGGTYRDNGFAVTLEQFSLMALEIGVPGTGVSVLGRIFGVNGRAVTDLVILESFLFVSRNFAEGERKKSEEEKVCRRIQGMSICLHSDTFNAASAAGARLRRARKM